MRPRVGSLFFYGWAGSLVELTHGALGFWVTARMSANGT